MQLLPGTMCSLALAPAGSERDGDTSLVSSQDKVAQDEMEEEDVLNWYVLRAACARGK